MGGSDSLIAAQGGDEQWMLNLVNKNITHQIRYHHPADTALGRQRTCADDFMGHPVQSFGK
jgi:hypothetical protein